MPGFFVSGRNGAFLQPVVWRRAGLVWRVVWTVTGGAWATGASPTSVSGCARLGGCSRTPVGNEHRMSSPSRNMNSACLSGCPAPRSAERQTLEVCREVVYVEKTGFRVSSEDAL